MSDNEAKSTGLELAQKRARAGFATDLKSEGVTDLAPHVEFRVGGRWYAVGAHSVTKVVTQESITRVPGRSKHILGLALIHDALTPVVDLALFTGISGAGGAARQVLTRARLVVVSHNDLSVAILADEARGIEMLPSVLEGTPDGIVAGETHWENQHVFHLAPEALVALGSD